MEPIYIGSKYQAVSFQKLKILQNGTLVTIALFLTHPVLCLQLNSEMIKLAYISQSQINILNYTSASYLCLSAVAATMYGWRSSSFIEFHFCPHALVISLAYDWKTKENHYNIVSDDHLFIRKHCC